MGSYSVVFSSSKSTELSQMELFTLNMKAFILLSILGLVMARPNPEDDGFSVSGGTLNAKRDIIGKIGNVTNEPSSTQTFLPGSGQNLATGDYSRAGDTTISDIKPSGSGATSIGGDQGLGVVKGQ